MIFSAAGRIGVQHRCRVSERRAGGMPLSASRGALFRFSNGFQFQPAVPRGDAHQGGRVLTRIDNFLSQVILDLPADDLADIPRPGLAARRHGRRWPKEHCRHTRI